MSQTVIGFFDNASDAQRAVEKLQATGISRDRIDVSRNDAANSAGSPDRSDTGTSAYDHNTVRTTADQRTVDREGRNTNKITDFFNSLFQGGKEDKDDDAGRYSRVAERTGGMVTVHAGSKDEAERAADLLDECGAIDVDERASQYGFESRRAGTSAGHSQMTTGTSRIRSRIVDRRVEDNYRLRDDSSGSLGSSDMRTGF